MKEQRLHDLPFHLNILKKYFVFVIVIFAFEIVTNAQALPAVSATGSASTTSSSFSTVTGASVTINTTDVNAILVVSTFQLDMSEATAAERNAGLRIIDVADDNINSGEIHRSLSNAKSTDFGIGSVVYIFDVSALSGDRTYSLQHNMSNNRTLTTNATIVAIALKYGSEYLKNDVQRVSAPVSMSGSWTEVTGSTTTITSTFDGGFYVAASIQSICTTAPAVGEWKLQYQIDSGTWTDLTYAVERSMSNTSDIGIINLVGTLHDGSLAGEYKFRIAHRELSGVAITSVANIVAVSLGTIDGVFPVFLKQATEATTTSTSLENAVTTTMTPVANTKLFIHAQYEMSATAESNSPTFDLYVDNAMLDGSNQKRFLSSSSDYGSGASVGLSDELTADTTYIVSLRHASTAEVTLSTNSISLNGFGLTIQSGPLPIELIYFNAQCGFHSGVNVNWATFSETNNDYFTLYKSDDCVNWVDMGRIYGAENSNTVIQYEYTDKLLVIHETYYKLRQTDYDGKSEEFEVISINCNYDYKDITIFPNPTKDYFFFSFYNENQLGKPLKILIYNSLGQLCFSEDLFSNKKENLHKINFPNHLNPGVYYFYSILGEDFFYTIQINKIN